MAALVLCLCCVLSVVFQEIRQCPILGCLLNPVVVPDSPLLEIRRYVGHPVCAFPVQRLSEHYPLVVGFDFLQCFEYHYCVATTIGMPARKFEILGVTSGQLIANVGKRSSIEGVVIR